MAYFFSKLVPLLAQACSTCTLSDASTPYYLKFILFMTSLPVLFVGGVALYLKRKGSSHAADE
jgi:hypothetical protein